MPLHVKQPDKPNEKNWDKKLKSTYVCTANISDKLEWYSRHKKYYLILQIYRNCQIFPPQKLKLILKLLIIRSNKHDKMVLIACLTCISNLM